MSSEELHCPLSGRDCVTLANEAGIYNSSTIDSLISSYRSSPSYGVIPFSNFVGDQQTKTSISSSSHKKKRSSKVRSTRKSKPQVGRTKDVVFADDQSIQIEIFLNDDENESVTSSTPSEETGSPVSVASLFGSVEQSTYSLPEIDPTGTKIGDDLLSIGSHSKGRRGRHRRHGLKGWHSTNTSYTSRGIGSDCSEEEGREGVISVADCVAGDLLSSHKRENIGEQEEGDDKKKQVREAFVGNMLYASDQFCNSLHPLLAKLENEDPAMRIAVFSKLANEFTSSCSTEFAKQNNSVDTRVEGWKEAYISSYFKEASSMAHTIGSYLCEYLADVPSGEALRPKDRPDYSKSTLSPSLGHGGKYTLLEYKNAAEELGRKGYRVVPKVIEENPRANVHELEQLHNELIKFGYFPIRGSLTCEKGDPEEIKNQWKEVVPTAQLHKLFPHLSKECAISSDSKVCHLLPSEVLYIILQGKDEKKQKTKRSSVVRTPAQAKLASYEVGDVAKQMAKIACIQSIAPHHVKEDLPFVFVSSMLHNFNGSQSSPQPSRGSSKGDRIKERGNPSPAVYKISAPALYGNVVGIVNSLLMTNTLSNDVPLRESLMERMSATKDQIDSCMSKSTRPEFVKWLRPFSLETTTDHNRYSIGGRVRGSPVNILKKIARREISRSPAITPKKPTFCFDIESSSDGDD